MCYKARVKKCGGCGLKCLTSGIRLRSPDGIGEAALFCRAAIVCILICIKQRNTRRMITAGCFYYWVNSQLMPAALRLIILR